MPSQPKGRKSRKVAKGQKARQTRQQREARQARRDRKNRKDYEARGVAASADTSFHRFPDLPLELREMIWENCIPSRLIFHGLKFHDQLDIGLRQSQRRPPIISHVCHEARRVAFRHGSRITIGTWYSGPSRALDHPVPGRSEEKAWFDTMRDTLLLCQTRLEMPFAYFLHMGTPYWLHISNDVVVAVKKSGRLGCIGPYPSLSISETQSVSDILGSEWLHGADVGYVTKIYYLLAPLPAIMESGLFGLFGENRAIAVDLDDTDTFRALKKLQSPCHDCMKFHDLAWRFEGQRIDDFDDLNEIAIEEISKNGKEWWLSGRLNPGANQLHEEKPESRLLALVFLVLDE